jgi:sugar phosphate isomerase/epimerase
VAAALTVSSWTLGETVDFETRVRIAAEAGYAGVGLRAENYLAARDAGLDDTTMLTILEQYGVAVREVEYLTGWGTGADRDREEAIFHMARLFGAPHMNAGLLEKPPLDQITAGFAGLCDRAGELTVGLEFMPYSGVPDLATAWAVLRDAGRPNAGLLVDAWHWSRAGMTAADLSPVPAERIVGIQLCDVGEQPLEPLRRESLHHRLPPGQGFGDVTGMLDALRDKGVHAPVSVEVISDELQARGLDVAAAVCRAAAEGVLGDRRF